MATIGGRNMLQATLLHDNKFTYLYVYLLALSPKTNHQFMVMYH